MLTCDVGYAVGQLRGDVLKLDIADGDNNSTIQGNFTLCMLYRTPTPDVDRFDIYDFATRCVCSVGRVLKMPCSDPDYAIKSFHPRYLTTWFMITPTGESVSIYWRICKSLV